MSEEPYRPDILSDALARTSAFTGVVRMRCTYEDFDAQMRSLTQLQGRGAHELSRIAIPVTLAHENIHYIQYNSCLYLIERMRRLDGMIATLARASLKKELDRATMARLREQYRAFAQEMTVATGRYSVLQILESVAVIESIAALADLSGDADAIVDTALEFYKHFPAPIYLQLITELRDELGAMFIVHFFPLCAFRALQTSDPSRAFDDEVRGIREMSSINWDMVMLAAPHRVFAPGFAEQWMNAFRGATTRLIPRSWLKATQAAILQAGPRAIDMLARPAHHLFFAYEHLALPDQQGALGVAPLLMFNGGRGFLQGVLREHDGVVTDLLHAEALWGAALHILDPQPRRMTCTHFECPGYATRLCWSAHGFDPKGNWQACAFPDNFTQMFGRPPWDWREPA